MRLAPDEHRHLAIALRRDGHERAARQHEQKADALETPLRTPYKHQSPTQIHEHARLVRQRRGPEHISTRLDPLANWKKKRKQSGPTLH